MNPALYRAMAAKKEERKKSPDTYSKPVTQSRVQSNAPPTVEYTVRLRYCGLQKLFGALEQLPDGKNKMIKKERTVEINVPIDSSKENVIDELNTQLKKGYIYDDTSTNNSFNSRDPNIVTSLKDYTIDLAKTELCTDSPNCLLAYLNGPNDNECDSNDDKYHDIYETELASYNDHSYVPPDLKLVDVNSLKENNKYFIKINLPNNKTILHDPPIHLNYIKAKGNQKIPLKNAIGIYKSFDSYSHNAGKRYTFKFSQISPVKFHDTVMVREPNPKNENGYSVNDCNISFLNYVIPSYGEPKVKILDYISFYELPPAYDKLFSRNLFGLYRGGKRSNKKGIYKKRTNKKRSNKKRITRRFN